MTSMTSGKSYIGKSKNVERRIIEHLNEAKAGSTFHFHKAIRCYGIDDFELTILEQLFETDNECEKYWINYYDTYNNGYNMTLGGDTGGVKPETIKRLQEKDEDGLSIFQKRSLKGAQTAKSNDNDSIRTEKIKSKMLQVDEDGLNKYQKIGLKNKQHRASLSKEENDILRLKLKKGWTKQTDEEKKDFSSKRRKLAKIQRQNESEEIKLKRQNALTESCKNTISAYNIKTKIHERVPREEWQNNPLLCSVTTNYITKMIYKENVYYLLNPNSYMKFSSDFSCKIGWIKTAVSNKEAFVHTKKQHQHLDGMIRIRIAFDDLTEEIIKEIEKLNYI